MASDFYEDLLRDIVKEINLLAENHDDGNGTEFDRGYRAGMMVVMKAIQDEIAAFGEFGTGEPLNLIDVDAWFGSLPHTG